MVRLDDPRRDLDIINRSGEHLLGLINDLLDVAKIESGRKDIQITACDLGKLVQDVTSMIRGRSEQKGLALQVEAPASPLFVRTDAARLRQVLINLLNNAIKFTERGSVTLRWTAKPANAADRLLLRFEIEDTGMGIATEDQSRIFDPFVQTGKAYQQQGVGLGLTISRQLVELMGGTVEVESTPGQGACFRIDLPVDQAEASEVTAEDEQPEVLALEAGQPEHRILIVEDDTESALLLEQLLQSAGFSVQVARDGAEGVQRFRDWRPQFVWMDLHLPVIDGAGSSAPDSGFRRWTGCEDRGAHRLRLHRRAERDPCRRLRRLHSQTLPAGGDLRLHGTTSRSSIRTQTARGWRGSSCGVAVRRSRRAPRRCTDELRQAVIQLQSDRVSAVIERIANENADLGKILASYAARYAYTPIIKALDAV